MRFLFLLFACLLAWSVSGKQLYINFADLPDDYSPTNFHSALAGEGSPGHWKTINVAVPSMFGTLSKLATPNHRTVLAQTDEDMTDEHFPMFIYDGDIYRDFKVSTRFEIVSGIAEQMAGIVFRFQNSSNFYVARVSTLGQNIRFYKVVNGERSDPIGPMINVPAGTWHTLGVQCTGNHIDISLDDHPVIPTLNDTTFTEGKIGFWTKSDALTYFADLTLEYTPRIPAAQTMVDTVMLQEPRVLDLRIYTLQTQNNTNFTQVIAAKMTNEVGLVGTAYEMGAITNGAIFYGTEHDAVFVTMPLRDVNGDYIAAMRVKLRHYFTESRDAAVTRATMIRKKLEDQCSSMDELLGR